MPGDLNLLKEEIKKEINSANEFAVIQYAKELNEKASINEKLFGKTNILMMAAHFGLEKTVQQLLESYKDTIDLDATTKYGTALMSSITEGHPKVAEMLIKNGADVNITNTFGANALGLAEQLGQNNIAKLLKDKGAVSLLPVEYALRIDSLADKLRSHIEQRREAAAIELIKQMTVEQLNEQIAGKSTPLMFAAYRGCEKVVKALVEKGVDISVANVYGDAGQIARDNGNQAIANMLEVAINPNGEVNISAEQSKQFDKLTSSLNLRGAIISPQNSIAQSPSAAVSNSYSTAAQNVGIVALGAVAIKGAVELGRNIDKYLKGGKVAENDGHTKKAAHNKDAIGR